MWSSPVGSSKKHVEEGRARRLQVAVMAQHLCHQLHQEGPCVQLQNGVSEQPLPGCKVAWPLTASCLE